MNNVNEDEKNVTNTIFYFIILNHKITLSFEKKSSRCQIYNYIILFLGYQHREFILTTRVPTT